MRILPKTDVATIRALHRAAHESLRELKIAKAKRVGRLNDIREFCKERGISLLTFSRYALGLYGGKVKR